MWSFTADTQPCVLAAVLLLLLPLPHEPGGRAAEVCRQRVLWRLVVRTDLSSPSLQSHVLYATVFFIYTLVFVCCGTITSHSSTAPNHLYIHPPPFHSPLHSIPRLNATVFFHYIQYIAYSFELLTSTITCPKPSVYLFMCAAGILTLFSSSGRCGISQCTAGPSGILVYS